MVGLSSIMGLQRNLKWRYCKPHLVKCQLGFPLTQFWTLSILLLEFQGWIHPVQPCWPLLQFLYNDKMAQEPNVICRKNCYYLYVSSHWCTSKKNWLLNSGNFIQKSNVDNITLHFVVSDFQVSAIKSRILNFCQHLKSWLKTFYICKIYICIFSIEIITRTDFKWKETSRFEI